MRPIGLAGLAATQSEMVLGGVVFIVLFCAWVVVPALIKKRHAAKLEEVGE